jgi:hypothetical protein
MSDDVVLDLVTPPGSPPQLDSGGAPEVLEVVQPLDSGGPPEVLEVVPQLDSGGPPEVLEVVPLSKGKKSKGKDRAVRKLMITVAVAKDFTGGFKESDLDIAYWLGQLGMEDVMLVREPLGNQGLQYLFPAMGDAACKVRIIVAHSFPYADDQPSKNKNDPRQCISLCEYVERGRQPKLSGKTFLELAAAVKGKDRLDALIVGCCQGDKFAKLLTDKHLKPDAVVAFFGGPDEDPTDGVHTWVVAEFVEKFAETVKDRLHSDVPLDMEEIFKAVYVQMGEDNVGPSSKWDLKTKAGDFEYAKIWLDMSSKTAEKHPSFVMDFTLAGDLHLHKNGIDLVTDELKAQRARYQQEVQRKVDMQDVSGARRARKRDTPSSPDGDGCDGAARD